MLCTIAIRSQLSYSDSLYHAIITYINQSRSESVNRFGYYYVFILERHQYVCVCLTLFIHEFILNGNKMVESGK